MVMRPGHIAKDGTAEVTNPQQANSSVQLPEGMSRFNYGASISKHIWSRMKFLLVGVAFKDASILESDKEVIVF